MPRRPPLASRVDSLLLDIRGYAVPFFDSGNSSPPAVRYHRYLTAECPSSAPAAAASDLDLKARRKAQVHGGGAPGPLTPRHFFSMADVMHRGSMQICDGGPHPSLGKTVVSRIQGITIASEGLKQSLWSPWRMFRVMRIRRIGRTDFAWKMCKEGMCSQTFRFLITSITSALGDKYLSMQKGGLL